NVLSHGMSMIGIGRRDPELAVRSGLNPCFSHAFRHRLAVAATALSGQFGMHAGRSIGLTAGLMNVTNLLREFRTTSDCQALVTTAPGIEPAAGDMQHSTLHRDRPLL